MVIGSHAGNDDDLVDVFHVPYFFDSILFLFIYHRYFVICSSAILLAVACMSIVQ